VPRGGFRLKFRRKTVARLASVLVFVGAVLTSTISAQNLPSTTKNVAGTLLAAQSIAALTHGSPISSVRLSAAVTWITGPDPEAGTGELLAKGTSESRIDLTLNGGGKRTEIRNRFRGPAGEWVNPDGKSGKYSFYNCWTDTAWFFPALSSLANVANSAFVYSYIGDETWHGLSAKHLRIYQTLDNFDEAKRLSAMDFYLDPTSLLVLGVAYKTHPDNNLSADLLTEVRYADYRLVNGIEVPFHIQRLEIGALLTDVTVSSASFNGGLSDETFATH
jgi:hypothetical protein